MNISEKAAYLKGLISGMEYDVNSREGKLFAGIIDLLEDNDDVQNVFHNWDE